MKRLEFASILSATTLPLSFCFAGTSTPLSLAELPEKILKAAEAAAPSALFERAVLEVEDDGTEVYEVIGFEPEHDFETVPSSPKEIDIEQFEDDGFGLQLIKVTLSEVEVEVDLFANGEIEEVERVIPVKLVPGMVLKRVRDEYPQMQVDRVEASYSRYGKIFQYEFTGLQDGVALDLEVSADGREIVEADD